MLIAAMMGIGRDWSLADAALGRSWARGVGDLVSALRAGWLRVILEMTVVTGFALGFGAVVDLLVGPGSVRPVQVTLGLDPAASPAVADGLTGAVRNAVVIPISLLAMLQSVRVLPPLHGRRPSTSEHLLPGQRGDR